MYRHGHYGAVLILYAPVAILATTGITPQTIIVGAVVAVGCATLPDIDLRLPFIRHRGVIHTVWFAGIAGVLLTIGLAVATSWFIVALYLGVAATLSLCSHLLADAMTTMGMRPFEPFWSTRYSLNIVLSENPVANYGLLGAGIAVSGSVLRYSSSGSNQDGSLGRTAIAL